MTEKFEITRLQTRAFRAKHLASGQIFELRGKQAVHYWTAHKVEKGVVSKNVYLDNWQSKKKLLEDIDAQIMKIQERENAAAAARYAQRKARAAKLARKGLHRFRPQVYAKLQRKKLTEHSILLYAPGTEEKFLMSWGADGYRIDFQPEQKQPICTGMSDENAAVLELYYYLDVDLTAENRQDYLDNCFRKSPS